MSKTTIHYSVPASSGDERYSVVVNGGWELDPDADDMATFCAEDFMYEHGGREASWPIVFVLHESSDGPGVVQFLVEREDHPVFFATEEKKL